MHHTGNGTARPTVEATAKYQIGPGTVSPFPGVAYTLYCEADASIVVCWDLIVEPWSQGIGSPSEDENGEGINNRRGVSCCFAGQDPTAWQWAAMSAARQVASIVVGADLLPTSHRRVDPGTTDCPGDVADARLISP